ncbi:MAG: hypothetical protein ACM3WP_15535 [Acidobacteriota bacterium]
MRDTDKQNVRKVGTIAAVAGTILLALAACTSQPKSKAREGRQAQLKETASQDHFDGGTYCVQTFLQGPPPAQPLHFSYKVVESDPSSKTKDYEADLASETLDVTYHERWLASDQDRAMISDMRKFNDPKSVIREIKDGYAETTFINHYTRSDASEWRMAATGMAQAGTPWNLFVSRPTVNRTGNENVNGYDTVKYSVDTTHDSQTDKAALMMFSKLKDYNITGNAWVLKDPNCVLQYSLDYEQESKDGKASKTHYEGVVTKK